MPQTSNCSNSYAKGALALLTGQTSPMNGSLQLLEYPGDMVRLSCEKYGRSDQYRKQNLIEKYGSDIRLPDLREEIAKCGRHGNCMTPAWFIIMIWSLSDSKNKKARNGNGSIVTGQGSLGSLSDAILTRFG